MKYLLVVLLVLGGCSNAHAESFTVDSGDGTHQVSINGAQLPDTFSNPLLIETTWTAAVSPWPAIGTSMGHAVGPAGLYWTR